MKKNKSFLFKKIYVGYNLIHLNFFKSLKKIKSSFKLGKLIFATFHVSYGISFNKNMKKTGDLMIIIHSPIFMATWVYIIFIYVFCFLVRLIK